MGAMRLPGDTMSDVTDDGVVVGAVDGPRARLLAACRRGESLQSGTFLEHFGLDPVEATTLNHNGDRVIDTSSEAGQMLIAFQDLLDRQEIHVQRGRNGGIKAGPKPPPNPRNATNTALAILRRSR